MLGIQVLLACWYIWTFLTDIQTHKQTFRLLFIDFKSSGSSFVNPILKYYDGHLIPSIIFGIMNSRYQHKFDTINSSINCYCILFDLTM